MPQSMANALLHIIFSTKHRTPLLNTPELRGTMTGYLIGTLTNIDCPSLIVGVVEDHIHILCNHGRTITIAKLIEEIKTSSSSRIKEEGASVQDFYWQSRYGAFSVSQSKMEAVKTYIADQEEHHRKMNFRRSIGSS